MAAAAEGWGWLVGELRSENSSCRLVRGGVVREHDGFSSTLFLNPSLQGDMVQKVCYMGKSRALNAIKVLKMSSRGVILHFNVVEISTL